MSEDTDGPVQNTDRELWRDIDDELARGAGDYYAPSVHVTADGRLGINVDGLVFVRPLRFWHALAVAESKGPMTEPYDPAHGVSGQPYAPPRLSGPYTGGVRPALNEAIAMARSEGRYVIPTGDVAALDAMLDAVLPVVGAMLSEARADGAAEERERMLRDMDHWNDPLPSPAKVVARGTAKMRPVDGSS